MRSIIFDLDNTLYNAEQYFSKAFDKISEYLSTMCAVSRGRIYNDMMALWKEKTSMYPRLFDDLLNNLGLRAETGNIITIFNGYDGRLEPYDDVVPLLKELKRRRCKTGIITDGNVDRQRRKIEMLGLVGLFDIVVYAMEFGSPKPSEISFWEAMKRIKTEPHDSYYVGDNPIIDFEGAKKIGMQTIRLLQGEFASLAKNKYIDYEIKEVKEILDIIKGQ